MQNTPSQGAFYDSLGRSIEQNELLGSLLGVSGAVFLSLLGALGSLLVFWEASLETWGAPRTRFGSLDTLLGSS